MKQHIVKDIDWTLYKKEGKTVKDARAAIAKSEGEEELTAASMVVAIYNKGTLLLDDDVIPIDISKTVARVVPQHTYETALQQATPKPAEPPQQIEEQKQEAAPPEAPKKPTIAEIDLSKYIGQTVAAARSAIAQLVDLKENHVVALLLKSSVLKDDTTVPEGVSVREMTELTYENALSIGQNKDSPQAITPPQEILPEPAKSVKQPNKLSINKIDLSTYTEKTVVEARGEIAQLVDVPAGRIIVFYRNQDLILDNETLSDLSGVTASFMKTDQHTAFNAPKDRFTISDIDGAPIEIKGSTLEIALGNHFGDDEKVNRYQTKQGLIVGTDYSSTRFYLGDYDFYKYGDSLCYIPSDTKQADIQAALEEALSTADKRVGVKNLSIGRKTFEIEENPYVTCVVGNGLLNSRPLIKEVTIHSLDLAHVDDELGTNADLQNHHLITEHDGTKPLVHDQKIVVAAYPKEDYVKFKNIDGEIKALLLRTEGDPLETIKHELHSEDRHKLMCNGFNADFYVGKRDNHDYSDLTFHVAKTTSKLKLPDNNLIYIDRDLLNSEDDIKAALSKHLGYQVNLAWDDNDPELGIISRVQAIASAPTESQATSSTNNTSKNVLLGLVSGGSAALLTHLASTYLEIEVHDAAKIVIGVAAGYAMYRHLEKQNTPEHAVK